jgi:site-specific DNA-methyltransferase (adenine-specific)
MELYNGDCLEIMKSLPDKSVDLIICDLPYGCLSGGGQEKTRRRYANGKDTGTLIKQNEGVIAGCAWDIKIDLPSFWEQVKRIRKNPNSPCIHFCTTKFGYELIQSNEPEFRYDLVWDKQRGVSFLSANKMPMRSHEMIYVFSKAGAFYKRKDIPGTPYINSGGGAAKIYQSHKHGRKDPVIVDTRCVLSINSFPTTSGKGRHPTEKPIDLYKFLLERYCPAGGTVLDPTFGSGNSGKAAQALGLKYIGIEKDEAFFKKAKAILLPEDVVVLEL